MHCMQFSGYTQKDRILLYMGTSKKFEEIVNKDASRTQPRYHNKQWNKTQRIYDKLNKKNMRYNADKFQGMMFVEATPHGELTCRFRKILKDIKLNIKVIEKLGRSIRSVICKTYPFRNTMCVEENCVVWPEEATIFTFSHNLPRNSGQLKKQEIAKLHDFLLSAILQNFITEVFVFINTISLIFQYFDKRFTVYIFLKISIFV
ncbi:uncharacterized protein LOC118765098 [Octopus sinensis]|uniref:Uncharacterized protein LOC118765098 n=1 Tax=Octopus sinensis TaxID=2607531 RepID=A0A7E6F3U8_9MOLL|nr:uncharacterized protein LOC118765098 [Octopus sinensis]